MSNIKQIAAFIHKMSVTSYGGIDNPEIGRNLSGSCHVLKFTDTAGVIRTACVDMGGHQGTKNDYKLNTQVEVIPDVVVITHAHMDHIGRLPVVWKHPDFDGKIYMSHLTKEIGKEALLDAARIMMTKYEALKTKHLKKIETFKEVLRLKYEASKNDPTITKKKQTKAPKHRNSSGDNMTLSHAMPYKQVVSPSRRRHAVVEKSSQGDESIKMTLQMAEVILAEYKISTQKDIVVWDAAHKPIPPIFVEKDVVTMMTEVIVLPDGEFTNIIPGVSVRPYNAGHVLGSKSMLFSVQKGPKKKVYTYFSGDLGSYRWPTKPAGKIEVPGEEFPISLAYVESTYGGTVREDFSLGMEQLERDLTHAFERKDASVFACFSLDRAQRVLYELQLLQKKNGWTFPIYLDSPLAVAYTALYAEHAADLEFQTRMHNVEIIADKNQRKTLVKGETFRVFITSSGMAEGGPILGYLSKWIENDRIEFSFPGYMAENTTGWKLAVQNLKIIDIPKEELSEQKGTSTKKEKRKPMKGVVVEAKIHHYTHFSGHADEKDLLQWYRSLSKAPKMKLCIVHGVREGSSQGLLNTMKRRGIDVSKIKIPELREEVIVF